jgi:ATP-binding cassette subfamily B protein
MLSWPMIAFGWVTNLAQRGLASWGRMLEVLGEPPGISDADAVAGSLSADAIEGRLEFRHVTFRFDEQVVLDDVSFIVEAGQTVAIVGPTGSGKSTLLSLVARLHDPPPGTVFLDGVDVRSIPLAVLRGAVAMAPQEPFLFSDTLAANIAFAAGLAPDGAQVLARMEEAAAIARLDKDVAGFPRGLDTAVGERGITLSGGQKQRTSLARALMASPRVLLLDDTLSAVDTYTEEEILSRLRVAMRERTSLLVSHRISTVRDADVILVLERGRVVERGRHDELITAGGFYADLYRKQLLEDELAAS